MKLQNIALGLAAAAVAGVVAEEEATPFLLEETNYIFQGDIVTEYHEVEEMFGKETADNALANQAITYDESLDGVRRLGAPDPNRRFLWQGGKIYYYVPPNSFNAEDKVKIKEATRLISERTGLTFIESRSQGHYINFNSNSNGCSSSVGKTGGASQNLNLKRPAFEGDPHCMHVGTIAHEFLHAIGLWHEQSMSDRDNFVKILFDKIPSDKRFNFDIIRSTRDLGVPYAYSSIMHYSSKAFGDGETTIQAIDGRNGPVNQENTDRLGNRDDLDPSDALQLRIMYHCAIENPSVNPNSGNTYFVKTLETLCSPQCPCNHGQGNCNSDSDCKGNLKCTQGIGRYTYLVNDVIPLPASMGVCIDPDLPPSVAPTKSPTLPPTPLPTPESVPDECECKNTGGRFENCEFYSGLSNNVCLIKSDKPQSVEPECDLPAGGRLAYSTNFSNWYLIGCIPEDEASARQSDEAFASFDLPTSDVQESEGTPLPAVAIGSALGGALVVGAAMVIYKRTAASTTSDLAAAQDPFASFRTSDGPYENNQGKV